MADLIGKVKRYMSEKITSVEDDILSYQEGLAASKINAAYTYVPCAIENVTNFNITPLLMSGTTVKSENGVAFNTTTANVELASLTLSAISNLDAWAQGVKYVPGQLVKNPDADTAYLCNSEHTASTGGASAAADWAADLALGYWEKLSHTAFLKLNHTAAGATTKVANFRYKIEGYKVN